MERTALETIQILGLDLEFALIVLVLAGAGLANLAKVVVRRIMGRRSWETPV